MTKSELIARLAQRYPQLVAKDAEYAVKMILDAMTQALLAGNRIEIRGFGSFGLNYRPPRPGRAAAARFAARSLGRSRSRRRHAHRHLGDPPSRFLAAGGVRGEERRAGGAALLFRPRAGGAAGAGAVRFLRRRRAVRRARASHAARQAAKADCSSQEASPLGRTAGAAGTGPVAMEFEYWWLLGLPLFFGLGWMAARVDIKQIVTESRALPRSYFKGLNFLLNEQPDKAIEAFIEVVKVDPETVELHFALGSLFRRRGETERAIRMHRNLLERPDLGAEQRLHAMVELGQDYLKAGLLDRAEETLLKLKDSPHQAGALKSLIEIYQQEKDW